MRKDHWMRGAGIGGKPVSGGNSRAAFLALVAVLLIVCLMDACNWELNAYRVLAEAQTAYDSYYHEVVKLHEQGILNDAYFAQATLVAHRLYGLGQGATALMVAYKTIQDPAIKVKIDAAVKEIPGLIAELVQISRAVNPKAGLAPTAGELLEFESDSSPPLVKIALHLDSIDLLLGSREVRR